MEKLYAVIPHYLVPWNGHVLFQVPKFPQKWVS